MFTSISIYLNEMAPAELRDTTHDRCSPHKFVETRSNYHPRNRLTEKESISETIFQRLSDDNTTVATDPHTQICTTRLKHERKVTQEFLSQLYRLVTSGINRHIFTATHLSKSPERGERVQGEQW